MSKNTDPTDIEQYVTENREALIRVLTHSNNEFARACAWAILDEGSDDPDLEDLERELKHLKQQREAAG